MKPEEWEKTLYEREVKNNRDARKAKIKADERFERLYSDVEDTLGRSIRPQLEKSTVEPIEVKIVQFAREDSKELSSTWLRRNGWFVVDNGKVMTVDVYRSKKHYVKHTLEGFWTLEHILLLFIFGSTLWIYLDDKQEANEKESLGRAAIEGEV